MSAIPAASCSDSEGFSPTQPGVFIFRRDHRLAVVPPVRFGNVMRQSLTVLGSQVRDVGHALARHARGEPAGVGNIEVPADCLRRSVCTLAGVEGLRESRKPLKVTGLQMSGTVTA